MTERIDALLQQLLTAQHTTTQRAVLANTAQSANERADLMTEAAWAQGERDAIRDRILSEFEKVTAERDEALAACKAANEYIKEAIELGIDEPAPLKALRLQNILYAALAKAEEES